jgi:hypothetical protein
MYHRRSHITTLKCHSRFVLDCFFFVVGGAGSNESVEYRVMGLNSMREAARHFLTRVRGSDHGGREDGVVVCYEGSLEVLNGYL